MAIPPYHLRRGQNSEVKLETAKDEDRMALDYTIL
jgi:hypothetical protein